MYFEQFIYWCVWSYRICSSKFFRHNFWNTCNATGFRAWVFQSHTIERWEFYFWFMCVLSVDVDTCKVTHINIYIDNSWMQLNVDKISWFNHIFAHLCMYAIIYKLAWILCTHMTIISYIYIYHIYMQAGCV